MGGGDWHRTEALVGSNIGFDVGSFKYSTKLGFLNGVWCLMDYVGLGNKNNGFEWILREVVGCFELKQ